MYQIFVSSGDDDDDDYDDVIEVNDDDDDDTEVNDDNTEVNDDNTEVNDDDTEVNDDDMEVNDDNDDDKIELTTEAEKRVVRSPPSKRACWSHVAASNGMTSSSLLGDITKVNILLQ